MVEIGWHSIRPLNGKQADGFEELCAQLARLETQKAARFIRKAPPDAGAECFSIFPDQTEWAWQSKFISKLTEVQWKQIDKSVQTALDKHPRLVRYYVCTPLDRSDARIGKAQSVMARWNARVTTWEKWAHERKMNVEFIWWGNSELIDRLTPTSQEGRVRFWFDTEILGEKWFKDRQEEAVASAGQRYTPELNVSLPILERFDAFGRTSAFCESTWALARPIRKHQRSLEGYLRNSPVLEDGNSLSELDSVLKELRSQLARISHSPEERLNLSILQDEVRNAQRIVDSVSERASHIEKNRQSDIQTHDASAPHSRDLLVGLRHLLSQIRTTLHKTYAALGLAAELADSKILLLQGDAGTGKTHLLCDLTSLRNSSGLPTLLLLGQRFTDSSDPWSQGMLMAGLHHLPPDEFVGAFEAAAQASDSIAIVIIDALNEGNGRILWPCHLEAVLTRFERSSWIKVILSVRTSYKEYVLPNTVIARSSILEHRGFSEHEHEAVTRFFGYFELETPSTPMLAPEFSNPLFLKTLCEGLKKSGLKRLPRGFHGISQIFETYLRSLNSTLAKRLNFDPKLNLVAQAFQEIAKFQMDSRERELSRDSARSIVDSLLPGREFDRSLYFALVSEGILLENPRAGTDQNSQEYVQIVYERLSDHFLASFILGEHLDVQTPEQLFSEGGAFADFSFQSFKMSPGLIEAYCIQLPECIGRELSEFVPEFFDTWHHRDAFRKSLIWRATNAFSAQTTIALNALCQTEDDLSRTLDALLMMSTIPNHPMNANFLHSRLKKASMPERDSWWSIFVHKSFGQYGPIDKLVDWALFVKRESVLEEETVELISTVLMWSLSTSNRTMRDKGTKSLVNLLTGRTGAMVNTIAKFCDVDDLYILERLYAVAYGVAMRSHSTENIQSLANVVYKTVFATKNPPAHILLRDYARGVVERAIYLGAPLEVDTSFIRPPYGSQWPSLPTDDQIEAITARRDDNAGAFGNREWARYNIVNSVMEGDFARYILGTNFGRCEWLFVNRTDETWFSIEERKFRLLSRLSPREKAAWSKYLQSCDDANALLQTSLADLVVRLEHESIDSDEKIEAFLAQDSTIESNYTLAESRRDETLDNFLSVLAKTKQDEAIQVLGIAQNDSGEVVPHFPLQLIQRYILWRVFDLGWLTERFGHFDSTVSYSRFNTSSLAERIGKKYQWISLHEILAMIADNFQFFLGYGSNIDHRYEGPWQLGRRDIDPSSVLSNTPGGTGYQAHTPSWWGHVGYRNWGQDDIPSAWVERTNDLPAIEELLCVTRPFDGTKWLNLCGSFRWERPIAPYEFEEDIEKRTLLLNFKAYLIPARERKLFMDRSKDPHFCWACSSMHHRGNDVFFGEYGWSVASADVNCRGWIKTSDTPPSRLRLTTYEFLYEMGSLDASLDDSYTLRAPEGQMITDLALKWTGIGADFNDERAELICFDPTAHENGPTALLFREEILREYLIANKLALCWQILGEKRASGPGSNRAFRGELSIGGAYYLGSSAPIGTLSFSATLPEKDK